MIELISQTIQTTLDSFDFSFCIVVNILTYTIIKLIDEVNGNKAVTTWQKRLVLLMSISSTGVVYYLTGIDGKLLLNSAILAPVFWSWICKPLCAHFNIDYRKYDTTTQIHQEHVREDN